MLAGIEKPAKDATIPDDGLEYVLDEKDELHLNYLVHNAATMKIESLPMGE